MEKEKRRRACEEAAARKLAARAMTEYELRQFLRKKQFLPEEMEPVIQMLLEYRYLDDRRYAMEFFDYAFRKRWSRVRTMGELRKRGVGPEISEPAFLDYLDDHPAFSEREMARQEAENVLRMADLEAGDPVPEKIKGRVARRLAARGYSTGLIYDILSEMDR